VFIFNPLEPSAFGNISMACGVYFLTNELKKTWSEAKEFCCEIGMNLVSIYSLEKPNCIYDLLAKRKLQFIFRVLFCFWKYLHVFPIMSCIVSYISICILVFYVSSPNPNFSIYLCNIFIIMLTCLWKKQID
jgi:hypothetical protein